MDLLLRRNQALSYDDGTDALIDRSITKANVQGATIGDYAFRGCTQLSNLNVPNVMSIGQYAFKDCTGLTSIVLPNVTTLNGRIFEGCTNLIEATVPNLVTATGGYVFNGCTKLTKVSIPKLEYINGAQSMFAGCTALKTVVFPSHFRTFQNYIFSSCTSLEIYDAGKPTIPSGTYNVFNQTFFNNCSALHTIILRTQNSVLGLGNVNTFTSTKFASGGTGGTIYIPKALYDHLGDSTSLDYLANTNWATINGYGTITWAKIEGSQYEHYYADGTTIPS